MFQKLPLRIERCDFESCHIIHAVCFCVDFFLKLSVNSFVRLKNFPGPGPIWSRIDPDRENLKNIKKNKIDNRLSKLNNKRQRRIRFNY